MSVLPLPTPDRRVVRCANERCNRILRRPPINGLGPECAKAAGFEAPTTGRLRVTRQDGPDLFDQLNEGDNEMSSNTYTPTGETVREEWLIRITKPDGRTSDHGPMTTNPNGRDPVVWRCPPGSKVEKLRGTVTTIATEWESVSVTPPAVAQ